MAWETGQRTQLLQGHATLAPETVSPCSCVTQCSDVVPQQLLTGGKQDVQTGCPWVWGSGCVGSRAGVGRGWPCKAAGCGTEEGESWELQLVLQELRGFLDSCSSDDSRGG